MMNTQIPAGHDSHLTDSYMTQYVEEVCVHQMVPFLTLKYLLQPVDSMSQTALLDWSKLFT